MKAEQSGPISLSDIEYIIREAKADAEIQAYKDKIIAEIRRARAAGDNATVMRLVDDLCGEEKSQ